MAKSVLSFDVSGATIPVDHGFALYSALSSSLSFLHENREAGVALIRGTFCGNSALDISPRSRLRLLIPENDVDMYLPLSGVNLDIQGSILSVGIPRTMPLRPAPVLYAHLVTTRNGDQFERFESEIARQLRDLGVSCEWRIGKRKTFQVHKKQIVGYPMLVHGLDAGDSLRVQENGLGGRRKMGCGMFEPFKSK